MKEHKRRRNRLSQPKPNPQRARQEQAQELLNRYRPTEGTIDDRRKWANDLGEANMNLLYVPILYDRETGEILAVSQNVGDKL